MIAPVTKNCRFTHCDAIAASPSIPETPQVDPSLLNNAYELFFTFDLPVPHGLQNRLRGSREVFARQGLQREVVGSAKLDVRSRALKGDATCRSHRRNAYLQRSSPWIPQGRQSYAMVCQQIG